MSESINNKNYLIPINDYQMFQSSIVTEKSKPIVLLVTVGPDRAQDCPYCSVFKKVMQEVSKRAYAEDKKAPVYFASVEYSAETQLIARELQITQVPMIMILKPGKANQPIKCDLSKQQVHEFVQEHTGVNVGLSEEEIVQIMMNDEGFKKARKEQQQQAGQQQQQGGQAGQAEQQTSLSSWLRLGWQIGFISMFVILILFCLPYLTSIRRFTLLTVASWIIYVICQGGTVYNMIHNTGPFQYNPYTEQFTFLYPEMRSQFSLEGYFATACMVLGGACIVATTQLVPLVKSNYMRRLLALFLVCMFWICFGTVFVFFSLKMSGYMHGSNMYSYVQLATTLFGGN